MNEEAKLAAPTPLESWSKAEFIKTLRAKEAGGGELSIREAAYLELADRDAGKERLDLVRALEKIFKREHRSEQLEKKLGDAVGQFSEERRLRPLAPERLLRLGLHRYSEADLKEMVADFDAKRR